MNGLSLVDINIYLLNQRLRIEVEAIAQPIRHLEN